MFYLTTHSTHFIYSYMACPKQIQNVFNSNIDQLTDWLIYVLINNPFNTFLLILISRIICMTCGQGPDTEKHLLSPFHIQDSTYHSFVITVVEHWLEGEIAQWFNHEGLIQWPIATLANALPWNYNSPRVKYMQYLYIINICHILCGTVTLISNDS